MSQERDEDNRMIYQICSKLPMSWNWRNFLASKDIFESIDKISSNLTIKTLERSQLMSFECLYGWLWTSSINYSEQTSSAFTANFDNSIFLATLNMFLSIGNHRWILF